MSNKHRKRKKKQRKRHADRFFRSRLQKFDYYYTKFSSAQVLKNNKLEYKRFVHNNTKKYKFSLKSLEMDYVKPESLSSLIKISKKYWRKNYLEDFVKFKMSIFPNFWFTAKPKAVRMGKGKGEPKRKIFFLKKGKIIYELRVLKFNNGYLKKKNLFLHLLNMHFFFFILKLQHKLSFKNKIVNKKF